MAAPPPPPRRSASPGRRWSCRAHPPAGRGPTAPGPRAAPTPHALTSSRQVLTPLQALRGITLSPAWVAGEEHLAGRLAVGHRADLTVLAGNPLVVPDDEPAGLPVVLTVVAGRPIHRAAGL
ncbi:amidohydrolase family protein [Streptomyces collinus]|uniref:amidohydrolase family protein n=1 Tax=Streptomyces collinus TaxID=42684 RepID=UPI0033C693DC